MMDSADRDDELVAYSTSERPGLCEGQVMRIRRHPAAHQAGLAQYEFSVVLVAQANRFSQRTDYVAARFLLHPCRAFWRVPVSEALDGTL